VRTLTTESSGGSRLTYEKGLLNPRKNSNFYKTNSEGSHRALPGIMPGTQRTDSPGARYRVSNCNSAGACCLIKNSRDTTQIRPAANQVLCPQNTNADID
jgi:hypothetical protein